jgi:hypothetical protein
MASLVPQQLYHHQPLPTEKSIRVLALQPSPHLAAPIQCRLEAISLNDPPQYWALSYSWDAQTPNDPITILGSESSHDNDSPHKVLKVTANCIAAMRRLRHATEARTIWIDSICIDQTSLAERSSQVALMSEIYRVADRVIVWLGEGDSASARSIQLLTNIGDFESIRTVANIADQDYSLEAKKRLQGALHARARELLKGLYARVGWHDHD